MRLQRKWRPSLWLVLGGGLAGTLGLSFLGLIALRYLGPEIGFRQAVVVLATVILLGTAVLGWLMHRLIHRPLTELAAHANAIRLGQPAPPAPHHIGTVEGRDLAVAVLSMADRLGDRAISLSAFSDHVLHEMKTPVTAILAASELLEDASLPAEDTRILTQITAAARQLADHLAALRRVTETRETGFRGTARLSDILPDLRQAHPGLTIQAAGERIALPLSAEGLRIVLSQLLSNAEKAGARNVSLTTAVPDSLTIRDDGPGISPGNRDRVFDPFFTTRREQGGTGMGLAITRTLLLANGGTIRLLPDGPGAAFEIELSADPGKQPQSRDHAKTAASEPVDTY